MEARDERKAALPAVSDTPLVQTKMHIPLFCGRAVVNAASPVLA
jgi:hypothetical protein